jgi:thiosulfate/3-mercaptopyruvate sulfurtransferase
MQIIDARSPQRYNGEVPELGEGLLSGKVAGSINLYYKNLINEEGGTLKDRKELAEMFYKAKLDPLLSSIVYSGRAISASILDLAMRSLGNDKTILYLGSWE